MREIKYSYLHGHPDYVGLPYEKIREFKNLTDVLKEENIQEIRCGSAPYRPSKSLTPDLVIPARYACEGKGRMFIKRNKGEIVEIGCLNTKEIGCKVIFHKKERFCWFLKKKVWEVIESFTMYDPEKDVLPCSVMYIVVNKEVQS